MPGKREWITAREAARHLSVKLQTLYAYASRGLLESVPAPDGRGRRYPREAVERLKARHDARRGHAAVAASALRWGEPTLETSISEIRADGPYYRGHSAVALARGDVSFERVAELLWRGELGDGGAWPSARFAVRLPPPAQPPAASAYLAAALSSAALTDPTRHGASDAEELARARRIAVWLATVVAGRSRGASSRASVAELLLVSYGVRGSQRDARLVDRALILCAEHELNASTFTTRVTASAGADLYACLAAGLHALGGVRHGGMSARVEALLEEAVRVGGAERVVRERLARGDALPGFGHPLYPDGDPRAEALIEFARARPGSRQPLTPVLALVRAMQRAGQPAPNLDLGLVAVCRALSLPKGAPAALFALGRIAGWVAHALEQRRQGYLLRPRARYVPPSSA